MTIYTGTGPREASLTALEDKAGESTLHCNGQTTKRLKSLPMTDLIIETKELAISIDNIEIDSRELWKELQDPQTSLHEPSVVKRIKSS